MGIAAKRSGTVMALCSLLGYSRQAYYQQRVISEQRVLQQELVVQEVLRLRSRQKKIGTRKLQLLLRPFLSAHRIDIGRDALFDLLSAHKLLIRKRSRRVPQTTFSNHWLRKYPNLIVDMPNSDPRENAIAERVNGILKQELLEAIYSNFEQARRGVKDAIEIYNHERPHSSIDMLTPAQAHSLNGELKKHWKNYYLINKERRIQQL